MHSSMKTEKDRGALAKEHTTANETNTQKESDFMSNSTFQPGDLVRDTQTGELYRVAYSEDPLGYVGYYQITPQVKYIRPRFIVPFGAKPCDAEPTPAPAPEESECSEDQLHAELIALGASPKTTVAELCRWSTELNAPVTELYNAYASLGFIEGGSTNA